MEAIREFPPPNSKRRVQRFLAMVNFCHRFFLNCAGLMLPILNLLFIRLDMNRDVKAWFRSCPSGQRNKVQRHNRSQPGTFPNLDACFRHVHLAANGLVERFHCQLKTVLRAAQRPADWSDNVPLALLGMRLALKSDLDCSVAKLMFGTRLWLPGAMVTPNLLWC
ncbi:unnamed protein product [Dibothriocephalus latus]|uniref:Uncharacterized protein n=1 Tax=Dibothriocephalus latus TaxID=60516 RepID=A0A3P6V1T6_DIBLA|nr:unnamed protein product [Dibothriocephalus latus]